MGHVHSRQKIFGNFRRPKPLPAVCRCRRWQRGQETSCSCLVSVQERRVHVQLPRSYLRGSGFGPRSSIHNKRYARTPRTCPPCPRQCRMRPPILTDTYTSRPCCMPEARTTPDCNHMHPSWSSDLLDSASVQRLYCFWLHHLGVNFSILTPCCSLALVVFSHRKPRTHCQCKQLQTGTQTSGI